MASTTAGPAMQHPLDHLCAVGGGQRKTHILHLKVQRDLAAAIAKGAPADSDSGEADRNLPRLSSLLPAQAVDKGHQRVLVQQHVQALEVQLLGPEGRPPFKRRAEGETERFEGERTGTGKSAGNGGIRGGRRHLEIDAGDPQFTGTEVEVQGLEPRTRGKILFHQAAEQTGGDTVHRRAEEQVEHHDEKENRHASRQSGGQAETGKTPARLFLSGFLGFFAGSLLGQGFVLACLWGFSYTIILFK